MLKGILEACRRLSVQSEADRSPVQAEGLSKTVIAESSRQQVRLRPCSDPFSCSSERRGPNSTACEWEGVMGIRDMQKQRWRGYPGM